jgi:hypothetical protein
MMKQETIAVTLFRFTMLGMSCVLMPYLLTSQAYQTRQGTQRLRQRPFPSGDLTLKQLQQPRWKHGIIPFQKSTPGSSSSESSSVVGTKLTDRLSSCPIDAVVPSSVIVTRSEDGRDTGAWSSEEWAAWEANYCDLRYMSVSMLW